MTRRPDWHPSYGDTPPLRSVSRRSGRALQRAYDPTGPIPFPKQPTLAERTAAMRDRLGIPHPRPNYRVRAVTGVLCAVAALFFMDGPIIFGLVLNGLAVLALWPCLRDADDILG